MHMLSGRTCDMLKMVPDVVGRRAVPGREPNAVDGRIVDAVTGRDEYVTAVPGRELLPPLWELMDLAVIGRGGIAPVDGRGAEPGTAPGRGLDAGGPNGITGLTSGAGGAERPVTFAIVLWAGFFSGPASEAGISFEAELALREKGISADGLRDRFGVVDLEWPPSVRTSGKMSLGLRSSLVIIRLSNRSVSFCKARS